MKTRKIARKIISCLVLINFLSYGIPVYAQDESLSQENSSGLKAESSLYGQRWTGWRRPWPDRPN